MLGVPSALSLFAACGESRPAADPIGAAKSSSQLMGCETTPIHAGTKDYCVSNTRRPFRDAVHDCERMHGRLAVVDDAAKNKALTAAIGSPWGYGSGLWLGCSDEEKEGVWACDGKPMAFTNWAPGQPDNETALDDCLEWFADTGKWNDAACSVQLGYVCRGEASLKCTGKRVTIGASTFCAHGEALRDWDGAKKACIADGGKLATPSGEEESRALFDALKLPSAIPSKQPLEGVWIGMSDEAEEGKFRWIDGAPMTYANWLPGEPNDGKDRGAAEDCVTLTLGSGQWNDIECGTPLPYVCESK